MRNPPFSIGRGVASNATGSCGIRSPTFNVEKGRFRVVTYVSNIGDNCCNIGDEPANVVTMYANIGGGNSNIGGILRTDLGRTYLSVSLLIRILFLSLSAGDIAGKRIKLFTLMANTPIRIPIPRSIDGLLDLGADIYKKHQDDGKDSPLKSMKDYNWDKDGPNIAAANEKNKAAQTAAKLAEKLYAERDALMPDVKGIVTGTRDVLKGTYKKNPKTLGDWASR